MDEKDIKMMLLMGAVMGVSTNVSLTPEQIAARADAISEASMRYYRDHAAKLEAAKNLPVESPADETKNEEV